MKKLLVLFLLLLSFSVLYSCDLSGDLGGILGDTTTAPTTTAAPTLCTVSFELDGGVGGDDFAEQVTVKKGSTVSLPTPTREGHTFLGWYLGSEEDAEVFKNTDKVTGDLSLVAKWDPEEVTVTFLDHYGKTAAVRKIDWGTAATPPTLPAVIEDLRFDGWDTAFDAVSEDMTVRPIYVLNLYTVSFDTAGGTVIEDTGILVGRVPTRPEDPRKEAHSFRGWYLDAGFETEYRFDVALDADTVLYARFDADVPISTYEELLAIATQPDAGYYLVNDINCEGEVLTPIDKFSGVLDGNGYKIYNFVISDTQYTAGFFRENTGTISDIRFASFEFQHNVSTTGSTVSVGAIVGKNSGTLSGVSVEDATVNFKVTMPFYRCDGTYYYLYQCGGFVGMNAGTVSGCSVTAIIGVDLSSTHSGGYYEVTYESHIGGLCGHSKGGVLEKSTVCSGTIIDVAISTVENRSEIRADHFVGAFCGYNNEDNSTQQCSAFAELTVVGAGTANAGIFPSALVGYNRLGVVENCCAGGSVSVGGKNIHNLAGLVTLNRENSFIRSCYSTAVLTSTVSIANVGGITAQNKGSLIKSFYDGTITLSSGTIYGYAVGKNTMTVSKCYAADTAAITVGGAAKEPTNTLAEVVTADTLKTAAFFLETLFWDSEVWELVDGEYPVLK